MLELLMAGGPAAVKYKLTEVIPSGTPPSGWTAYSNTSILDRTKNQFSAIGSTTGDLITYDLLTNKWNDPVSAASSPLRNGTSFAECGSGNLGAYVKWGIQSSSYNTRALYYSGGKFYAAATWTTNCAYPLQCTVGNIAYIFGGQYAYSVDGNNTMAVRTYAMAGNQVALHGTTNPAAYPLRYNAAVGTDGKDIFVFGGVTSAQSGNTATKDILKYTVATKTWTLLANTMPITVGGGGNSPYYQGKFYFLGNATANGSAQNKSLWAYTVATGTWEQLVTFEELDGYRNGLLFIYNDLLYYVCPQLNSTIASRIWTVSLK